MDGVEVTKITKVLKESKGAVELCSHCGGKGWFWSDLEFGDIPGDESKISCTACNKTGRVMKVKLEVEALIPFSVEDLEE